MSQRNDRAVGGPPDTATPIWRSLALAVATVLLIGAIGIVVAGAITTSSARVSANTDSDGFLAAGTVAIDRADSSSELFFDADDLYPGLEVTGCIEVDYAGTVPADIRLSARADGGTGLDRYVDLTISTSADGTCVDGDVESGGPVEAAFSGRLSSFWSDHSDYATGLEITSGLRDGERVAVLATAVVIDDNDAAGRDVELTFVFESRPT